MDQRKVQNSCIVEHQLPDGSVAASMIARTSDGLYWWRCHTLPPQEAVNYAEALLESIDRWMRRDSPEPFTDECPTCGREIFVTYDGGRMQHRHGQPSCEPYSTLERVLGGNESPMLVSEWTGFEGLTLQGR